MTKTEAITFLLIAFVAVLMTYVDYRLEKKGSSLTEVIMIGVCLVFGTAGAIGLSCLILYSLYVIIGT